MDVSIVIPTLNSEETLEKCLQSIRANKTALEYEIIVCDAGSKDRTWEIAEKYNAKVFMGETNRINRNIGVKYAQGEIILFTDSDCLVPYDWISSLYYGLKEKHADNHLCVGIGGGNEPWLDNPTKVELSIAKAMKSPLIAFKARNTANYDKNRWVEHNPPINSAYYKYILGIYDFDERQGYPEDLDLDTRLIENGKKLYYMADCVVKHKHKTTYQGFAKQMEDFGYKRVKINKEHSSVRRLFHYAPAVLYLMQFSPFILVNLLLAAVNAIITNDGNVFDLTVQFYNSYGRGEIEGLFSKSSIS